MRASHSVRVARERPHLEDPLGLLQPRQQLEQAPLERRDVGRRQAGLPRRAEDRLESRLGREEPCGEVLVDGGRVRSQLRQPRARSVASSRCSAASTASVCSGCRPPCSAAAAADTTGSRCSCSSSSRVATASLARQPSSSASAASSASESCSAASRPAALVEVEPRPQREVLARQRHVAARQQRRQPLLRRQQHRALDLRRRQLARLLPVAVGDLLARPVADPRRHRHRLADLAHVRVRRRQPVAVDRAVEQRQRLADGLLALLHGLLQPARAHLRR